MGLLTTYLAYRYGKKKASGTRLRDRLASGADHQSLVCENCGFELSKHASDANRSCPDYGM